MSCNMHLENEAKIRLLELMIFRESGGVGYDQAIQHKAEEVGGDYYKSISNQIAQIKIKQ